MFLTTSSYATPASDDGESHSPGNETKYKDYIDLDAYFSTNRFGQRAPHTTYVLWFDNVPPPPPESSKEESSQSQAYIQIKNLTFWPYPDQI